MPVAHLPLLRALPCQEGTKLVLSSGHDEAPANGGHRVFGTMLDPPHEDVTWVRVYGWECADPRDVQRVSSTSPDGLEHERELEGSRVQAAELHAEGDGFPRSYLRECMDKPKSQSVGYAANWLKLKKALTSKSVQVHVEYHGPRIRNVPGSIATGYPVNLLFSCVAIGNIIRKVHPPRQPDLIRLPPKMSTEQLFDAESDDSENQIYFHALTRTARIYSPVVSLPRTNVGYSSSDGMRGAGVPCDQSRSKPLRNDQVRTRGNEPYVGEKRRDLSAPRRPFCYPCPSLSWSLIRSLTTHLNGFPSTGPDVARPPSPPSSSTFSSPPSSSTSLVGDIPAASLSVALRRSEPPDTLSRGVKCDSEDGSISICCRRGLRPRGTGRRTS